MLEHAMVTEPRAGGWRGWFGRYDKRIAHPPVWLLTALAAGYLILAWMQARAYAEGRYLGFPAEWFAQESGTIATDLALIYGPDSLRPAATFSEPSYFGFVLLSLSLMLVPLAGKEFRRTGGGSRLHIVGGFIRSGRLTRHSHGRLIVGLRRHLRRRKR